MARIDVRKLNYVQNLFTKITNMFCISIIYVMYVF